MDGKFKGMTVVLYTNDEGEPVEVTRMTNINSVSKMWKVTKEMFGMYKDRYPNVKVIQEDGQVLKDLILKTTKTGKTWMVDVNGNTETPKTVKAKTVKKEKKTKKTIVKKTAVFTADTEDEAV